MSKVELSLLVVAPAGSERRVPLQDVGELKIGRTKADNQLVLPSARVSRSHARLVVRDGKVLLVDLKSTNGTYVNGRKLTAPLVLHSGDEIAIGEFVAKVEGPANARRKKAPAPIPPPPPPPRQSTPVAPSAPTPTAGVRLACAEHEVWRGFLMAAISAGAAVFDAARIADEAMSLDRKRSRREGS